MRLHYIALHYNTALSGCAAEVTVTVSTTGSPVSLLEINGGVKAWLNITMSIAPIKLHMSSSLGLRTIDQSRKNHRQVLISSLIEQCIQCVISKARSSATQPWSGFNYHLTCDSQVAAI